MAGAVEHSRPLGASKGTVIKRIFLASQWVWVALLALALPFTSFPLVARLTGSSMVAPLSSVPMVVLLLIWLVPYLIRSGVLPRQTLVLFIFCTSALISTAAAFFIPFPPYKSANILSNSLKALITLGVGMCFYLVVALWPNHANRLRFLVRWINWSGVVVIGWSFFQAFIWHRYHSYPDWMWNFQGKMSSSLLLYVQRSNGFAYEPSWLAHQLNMLYLPLWLAASFSGFTAHRFHLGKLHFEHLLLLGGIATLVLSVSRIGLLTFLLMVAFLILLWNIQWVRWLQNRLTRNAGLGRRVRALRRWIALGSALVLLVVYAGLGLGAAYGISRYDPRMATLFNFTALKDQSFLYYANQLVFAERIVFWQAGWGVFNDHPILGVGLGNAGFFFPEKLSAFSWALTEIRTLIYQQSFVPNIKSLWVRLLAETGIVGFAIFACWCYILWQSAQFLRKLKDPLFKMIGLAGSFALIGFIMEGFSLDTFALPYYWFSFGLITAACEVARRSLIPPASPLSLQHPAEAALEDRGFDA